MRTLGRILIGLAILALIAVICGRFGVIPRLGPPGSIAIAALLLSVVGRRLYRSGSAGR
jgi:hypothetical protein